MLSVLDKVIIAAVVIVSALPLVLMARGRSD
jgi:hypothetical protein